MSNIAVNKNHQSETDLEDACLVPGNLVDGIPEDSYVIHTQTANTTHYRGPEGGNTGKVLKRAHCYQSRLAKPALRLGQG